MLRIKTNFIFMHTLHALFILTNLITGYFMLKGIKLINIHFVSGLLMVLIPLVLVNLTFKRRIFFNLILLRIKDIKRAKPIKILNKITAMAMFFLVIISFSTGLILRLGGGNIFFNIHIFSFKSIFIMMTAHLISAILSKT